MKNKQHDLRALKYQLEKRKDNGQRNVKWKLNRRQFEYITEVLGYEALPYLYIVKTKRFQSRELREKYHILKVLHYAADKRTYLTMSLTEKNRKILEDHNVLCRVAKYLIILRDD